GPFALHQSRGLGAAVAFRTGGRAMRSERSRSRFRLFDPQHDVCAALARVDKCAVTEIAALSDAAAARWARCLPRASPFMQARTVKYPRMGGCAHEQDQETGPGSGSLLHLANAKCCECTVPFF